jgi:hypothetical protein
MTTRRGRTQRGRFSRIEADEKSPAAKAGGVGHDVMVARVAAIRASWPTDALLEVLNCRSGVDVTLRSLRVVAKQWGGGGSTLDCPSQSSRVVLALTTAMATVVMRAMIKEQNPQHESVHAGVALTVMAWKEKSEALEQHAPLWATSPWGPLTPAERIGCAIVLDDCRLFMRALLDVPVPWLARLRRCQDPECRAFFWIETGRTKNRRYCSQTHGRQHRRLKSRPRP